MENTNPQGCPGETKLLLPTNVVPKLESVNDDIPGLRNPLRNKLLSTFKELLNPTRLFHDGKEIPICPLKNKYILSGFTLGILLHCMPFEWDSKRKKVIVSDSLSRKIGWTFATIIQILMSFHFLKTAIRNWGIRGENDENMGKFVESMYSCFQFSFITTLSLTNIWSRGDLIRTIYAVDSRESLFPRYRGTSSSRKKNWSRIGMIIGGFYYQTLIFGVLLFSIRLAMNEDNPNFIITTKGMEAGSLRTILMIFQWIILVYTKAALSSYSLSYSFPIIVYISDALTNLKALVTSSNQNAAFTHMERELSIYRRLYLKREAWDQIIAVLICPCYKAALVGSLVVNFYALVRVQGWSKCIFVPTALHNTISALIIFGSIGKLNALSKEFISWANIAGSSRADRKTAESLLPFRLHVGCFYYVDTGMVLTMLSTIVGLTVDLLYLDLK